MCAEKKEIRLTQMVTSAGCAAKLFPFILSDALKDIDWKTDENVLVGLSGKDDAGVYKINEDFALIHTTDFFTPVVDDPFTFGQIAAANSLSDVYAMGGVPMTALNIVAFPQKEDIKILNEILKGGVDKANEAGCIIFGGHSIDIPNIVYGLAVTGKIHPKDIKGNNTAKPGDILILTKALGTGILNNAVKYNNPDKSIYDNLIESMTRLNRNASVLMLNAKASGCTDVTGFGLAGHSMQMAQASKVVLVFNINKIPVLDGAEWAIKENLLTRGDKSNRIYTQDYMRTIGNIDEEKEHLIFDPQTSGGLLISVPEKNAHSLLNDLKNSGDEISEIVGYVEFPNDKYKEGTIVFDYTN
jgi:selenide,water dikinase